MFTHSLNSFIYVTAIGLLTGELDGHADDADVHRTDGDCGRVVRLGRE